MPNFTDKIKTKMSKMLENYAPEVENKVKQAVSKAMEPTTQRWMSYASFLLTGMAVFGSLKGVKATDLIFEPTKASTDAISIVIDHLEVINTYNYYPQKSGCGGCGGKCHHDGH